MKNKKSVEIVKSTIMKDLFKDISSQQCVIDILISDRKQMEKMKDSLNKVSIKFLNKCRMQLNAEADKGAIYFFRKYRYEKVLNEYLAKKYNVVSPEIVLFSSSEEKLNQDKVVEKRKNSNVGKKEKLELKSIEAVSIRQVCEKQEKRVVDSIGNLSWKKAFAVTGCIYESVYYDGKKIEVRVNTTTKNKNTTTTYSLKYDNKQLSYVVYDIKKIIDIIEQTHPKIVKKPNIIYVVNRDLNKNKPLIESPEDIAKKQEAIDKERQRREELKREKEEKKRVHEELMRKQQEMKRLKELERQEQIRKLEEEQQAKLRELPQIGVKDFVVKRAVFKCMHSKHEVIDLVATVRVVADDGKERLVKVSAGYCKQCKVYFIMESTYEKLRNMGIILCRICDEKSYMKNSFVNGMRLAQESILMQFGYTVSQEEGLSSTRRQKILAVMIDNKIISKSEIISYLDFFISQKQYQSRFELAVSKWEADREFVQEYRVGQYTQYGVNAIYRR